MRIEMCFKKVHPEYEMTNGQTEGEYKKPHITKI
mgnify:CR=1 FL=1